MSTVKTITSADLVARIAAEGGANVNVGLSLYRDATYALPSLAYLRAVMLPAFEVYQRKEDVWGGWAVRYDCDNYANELVTFAARCFAHTKDDTIADGFAVYRVFYCIDGDTTKRHAIAAALTDKGIVYIEPQTARIVELTDDEKGSIYHAY